MKLKIPQAARRRNMSAWLASALATTVAAVMVAVTPTPASAIATKVNLGRATSFSVLGASEVTNTGNSSLEGDLGVSPGSSITGFPPGVVGGAVHQTDAVAGGAQVDLTTAYNSAAGQATNFPLAAAIGAGQTLLPGVHTSTSGVLLTGDLILDAQGDPNAVWVFQIPEALTVASSARVLLTNGASACNVFWQIRDSATIGTGSSFVGTIMAGVSITVNTGANIQGRALARTGLVSLQNNRIFFGGCSTGTTGGTTTGTTTGGTTTGTVAGATTGGLLSGGLVTGGVLGGPIIDVTSGGTAGNIAGNIAGNTAGNTAGNSTSGNTEGNTAGGSVTGGPEHGGKPEGPEHGGKPEGPEHGGKPEGPDHGGKPEGPDHGGKPGPGHDVESGKPDHGKESDENFGYADVPNGHEADDYSKGYDDSED
ncbi:ice-binding family protein [Streptomyces olivochromogenes]|uniref:ice-binding family protein n=1 Tax=Streptomyces olivochromogenes TaxID=1963 RepID=UPI0036CE5AEC